METFNFILLIFHIFLHISHIFLHISLIILHIIFFIFPSYFFIFLGLEKNSKLPPPPFEYSLLAKNSHISSYFFLYWPWVLHISFIIPSYFFIFLRLRKIPSFLGSGTLRTIRAISSMDMKHVSIAGTWTGIYF